MEKSTNFEMFVEAKHYIDKHHVLWTYVVR